MPGQTDLYIFVEGTDDERFFERVVIPEAAQFYRTVRIISWAKLKPEKITNYVRSLTSMGAAWLFVTDNDNASCITACKERIQARFRSLDPAHIIVVLQEIESWYLAGASTSDKFPNMRHPGSTEHVTKETLSSFFPGQKKPNSGLLIELLEAFDATAARRNNRSFDYFYQKYLL